MIARLVSFLIGFIFMIIGFAYFIIYINLLSFGYTIYEYLEYCISRYECLLLVIGFIIILITVFRKGKKNDKCLWYNTKPTR